MALNLANLAKATLTGFDANTDQTSIDRGLPEGTYQAIIKQLYHRVYEKSGYDCIFVEFQAVQGEYAGKTESTNISFATTTKSGKEMPEFVIARSIKLIGAIAQFSGVALDPSVFASGNETTIHDDIAKLFEGNTGKPVTLEITERENKKKPDDPYKNYVVTKSEMESTINVTDDQLPFGDAPQQPQQPQVPQQPKQPQQPQAPQGQANNDPFADVNDDDLPF